MRAIPFGLMASILFLGTVEGISAQLGTGEGCVDFENLPDGEFYIVGDSFTDSGVTMEVRQFQWSNGIWFAGGLATVDAAGMAGHFGQDLNLGNVNLAFDFGACVGLLTLHFGEYGGNLNIDVNGDFRNFQNMDEIDGATIGGVTVSVTGGGGNDTGTLELQGPISSFTLGGQEFWIDHVCYEPCQEDTCIDYEDLTLGTEYASGEMFVDSGVPMTVRPFQWSNGTWTSEGRARVDGAGMAGHLGQDLNLNNVNVLFDFGPCVAGLSFHFGEYGGNLNININGDFRNFENMTEIDGATIGGVNVSVTGGGENDTGTVELDGGITFFSVGGQELWIDHVCYKPCPAIRCVDYEELALGTEFFVTDVFVDSGVPMTVRPFQWSSGTWTSGGRARVDGAGMGGHFGQDLNLGNANLAFDFGACVGHLSLRFGEYGGNLNIDVNGDFRNFENMTDIDGTVIGGVHVSVTGGSGGDTGTLKMHGGIASFAIGGQEFWIDHVCYVACLPEPVPLRITDVRRLSETTLRITFEYVGPVSLVFELQVAPVPGPGAPWTVDAGASIMPGPSMGVYHADTAIPAADESYYRVKGTEVGGS